MRRPTSTMSARSDASVRHAVRARIVVAAVRRSRRTAAARPSAIVTRALGQHERAADRIAHHLHAARRHLAAAAPAAARSRPSTIPSTSRQNARATMTTRTMNSSEPQQHQAPGFLAAAGVRRLQAVERALRRLPFGAVRRDRHHLLPRRVGAVEILLAERLHDADVQQRLGVLRIELERLVELRERLVRLVRCSSSRRRDRC